VNQNQVYTLTTPGTLPVLKAEAKLYVRVHSAVVADDALIDSMLDAVCYWGERYTGRSFRAQTWTMLQDSFGERIELRRSPLNAVTSVKHYVDGELAAVSADDYYLKKGRHWSEILLVDGSAWPTTTDTREQAIEVIFTTALWPDAKLTDNAILRHFLHMYENRGDCDHHSHSDMVRMARMSGATDLYDTIKITRA